MKRTKKPSKVHIGKKNLELGAGCGTFGHTFVPSCLITEKDKEKCQRACVELFVDWYCDALQTGLPDNYFESIYACNPVGYGFKNPDEASDFLNEVSRVIKNNGKLVILTTGNNRYSAPKRVERFIEQVDLGIEFECNVKEINSDFATHEFFKSVGDYKERTYPTHQIEIHVRK